MTFNTGNAVEVNPEASYFAINQTDGKTKRLEQIEEKEEYDHRKESNANSNDQNKRINQEKSSQDSDSDDAGTGNFSQIEKAVKPIESEFPSEEKKNHRQEVSIPPVQNLSEIISQTIKEQVSQGIQQILKTVTEQF